MTATADVAADVAAAAEHATAPAVPPGSDTAAVGFVTVWARPMLPAEQWVAGVRGYLAPDLEQALSYTDPAAVPATRVTGPVRMVHVQPDGAAASFDVPTDAGTVRVDLARLEGRWLVTDLVPAASTQPGD
jgi:hypothetical protein